LLAEHPGWVFSAGQLSGDPEEGDYSPESVSVLVSRLRHELAAAGALDVVETVHGVGYRLHSPKGSRDDPTGTSGVSRELRDASWQLQEAVIEVKHSGSLEQRLTAVEAFEQARRALYATLAE
jgi:DNA-binding winged helix-turn-helix (wHTH) protein